MRAILVRVPGVAVGIRRIFFVRMTMTIAGSVISSGRVSIVIGQFAGFVAFAGEEECQAGG